MDLSTTVIFNDKHYTLKYPTVGQILEIESLKQSLSAGRYGLLVVSNVKSMELALDLIDAIAYFSVLIPDLKKEIAVDSFMDLDAMTAKRLSISYKKYFRKWYSELEKEMNDLDAELLKELKEDEVKAKN